MSHGIAAGRIYKPPTTSASAAPQIRIAFDGDCVLFNEEADLIGREDLAAFHRHEHENAAIPLPDGPFAKLIRTISQMQGPDPDSTPFRIGLVTARNAPSHERAIRTLRSWNVRIDNAAFLGGLQKAPWLIAFQPQIFFDDQETYCGPASEVVPTARVPFPIAEIVAQPSGSPEHRNRFLLICKTYLKRGVGQHQLQLEQWYSSNLKSHDSATATEFLNELEESVVGTPVGKERPAKGDNNDKIDKFFSFMNALIQKHTPPSHAE